MNEQDLTRTLETLLSAPNTHHETLSALYELAPLRHKRLQEATTALKHQKTTLSPIANEIISEVLKRPPLTQSPINTQSPLNTQSYIDQLEQLLIDIDLLTTLTPTLSPPEQLRRALMTEATRDLITDGTERRDQALLELLAVASKALGELLLAKPERWIDEGVGRLLADLAPLAGGERRGVWVEEMSDDDVTECARWRPLLGALRRGAEGREVCMPHDVVDRVARRVGEAVRAEVVYVAERVRVLGVVGRRAVGEVEFGMVYCPPGEFWMGSEEGVGRDNERPRHRVKLSRGFWMGQTQVTQGLWEKVMGNNPSRFKGAQRPVEKVSWFDAVRFCNALSSTEGLTPAYGIGTGDQPSVSLDLKANGYKLPTEAEWEYAAKAGTELKYAGGDDLNAVAWYGGNAGLETHPVGTKKANAWGIYDMSGNVWEWCSDQWDLNPYTQRSGTVTDPLVYAAGPSPRVLRGGSSWIGADDCRVACRGSYVADDRRNGLGFRLLRCEP